MYNNFKYIPNWHHISTANILTEFISDPNKKKIMIFQPPQHGKSELCSRNLPAYYLGTNIGGKVLSASYSIDLGRFFSRDVQRIMTSETYNDVFPKSSLIDSKLTKTSDYFEVNGGFYKAIGVTGGISGFPGDLGIIDDPIKGALEAHSKTYRDRVWEWYLSEFTARLHNNSKQIIIMTRWHEDDLCGRILEHEGSEWDIVSYPAILEELNIKDPRSFGQALWGERHNLEKLHKIKSMSERVFNSLYQQRPTAMEGNIIKRNWFGRFDIEEVAGQPVNFVVDTAYSKDSTADYSVILAYVEKNNCYYILNISRTKLDFPEFITELKSQVNIWGTNSSKIKVEPKATGKTVVQQLRQITRLNITEAPAPTTDKVSRYMAVSPIVESKRVLLLNNSHWLPNFLEETGQFPNGKNDDQVDCMIMMIEEQKVAFGGFYG